MPLHMEDLQYLRPEMVLVIVAVLAAILDLAMPKQISRHILGWFTLAGIILATLFTGMQFDLEKPVALLDQSYRVDDFSILFKLFFLGATGLIVLMSIGTVKREEIPQLGEFYYLFLPATLGAIIMASSGDLITMFIGLELLSITSYILVGMRKNHLRSNEGAFKYLVLGGISSAFVLYGMSFLYGMTGSTSLDMINAGLQQVLNNYGALTYVSFFLMFLGFGFKLSAAPFHNWAPDVYQGAPTPVTTFLAVVSKAAGLAILFRIAYSVFFGLGSLQVQHLSNDVFKALAVLAAVTMIVGNFSALKQRNMKRLLALSGVANAGYLLVPIATKFSAFHYSNFSELFYYLIAYLLMTIGAFAVFMAVGESTNSEETRAFAGLYYRAPFTAAAMTVLLVSLAGFPITGGFFGKLYIIMGTLQLQNYWLAAIMIGTSVASFYYYFGIIRQMYMRTSDVPGQVVVRVPLGITIWLTTIATFWMGLFPQQILQGIEQVFSLSADLFIR
ncbi:MAG TPA: NADH-quinone oxidoreductase subunit N [Bacilli bacterium]